jgi:hypothetical protein
MVVASMLTLQNIKIKVSYVNTKTYLKLKWYWVDNNACNVIFHGACIRVSSPQCIIFSNNEIGMRLVSGLQS